MEIDGLSLGSDIFRENRQGHSGLDGRMVLSRNGTPLISDQPAGPQPFDLVGSENSGLLTYAQVKAVKAKAAISGATYDLVYDSETTSVRFRSWDQPVIEYTPIGDREGLLDTDICKNIRIKLMEA